MAVTKFQLKGVEELKKKLRKLRGTAMRRALRQAVRAAAKPVRDLAKQIVLDDSGALRRSLKVKSGRRSKKLISAIIVPGTRAQLGIAENATGFYPTHIELGRKGKTQPNRFLRDAMELQRQDAIKDITKGVQDGIARATQ